MQVYHDFFLVPGSRSMFPDMDPDPKHCMAIFLQKLVRNHQKYLFWAQYISYSIPRQSPPHWKSWNRPVFTKLGAKRKTKKWGKEISWPRSQNLEFVLLYNLCPLIREQQNNLQSLESKLQTAHRRVKTKRLKHIKYYF